MGSSPPPSEARPTFALLALGTHIPATRPTPTDQIPNDNSLTNIWAAL